LGLNKEEFVELIKKYPSISSYGEENLEEKFNYFKKFGNKDEIKEYIISGIMNGKIKFNFLLGASFLGNILPKIYFAQNYNKPILNIDDLAKYLTTHDGPFVKSIIKDNPKKINFLDAYNNFKSLKEESKKAIKPLSGPTENLKIEEKLNKMRKYPMKNFYIKYFMKHYKLDDENKKENEKKLKSLLESITSEESFIEFLEKNLINFNREEYEKEKQKYNSELKEREALMRI
ncbi:MAG: hypothetical protein ACP5LH_02660, partial [Candidatus Micrarchaeia archaeon]